MAKSGVIDVTLKESSVMLNDVVVVGYGVQKKSSVTGAISQIKAEDIQNRTITNPQSALQGKTAGVQVVTTSNAPGSSPTIRVRGYSSNVSSDPLYVVDGVRLSDISGIDPNDIASMEVLKDAASAAIYGAEAGNGVVLITTKRGSAGNGKISYDFQYAWERPARIPRMLNAEQYIQYMSEGNFFTEDYLLRSWDGVTNTSWIDEAFETGHMQRHNLSFTNGNDRGNYYLSLSYLNNDGIVGGGKDKYERRHKRRIRHQDLAQGGHHQPDREIQLKLGVEQQRIRKPYHCNPDDGSPHTVPLRPRAAPPAHGQRPERRQDTACRQRRQLLRRVAVSQL